MFLIKYTPITEWIHGDGNRENKELVRINTRILAMQNRLEAQNTYITQLQRKLSGEEIEYPELALDSTIATSDTTAILPIRRIPYDDSLRKRVQRSNINVPVRSPLILNVVDEGNLEDEQLIPPIQGVIRKPFSLIDNHLGVDILAPENSAVKCILDGLVIESDWTLEGGNTIIIQHKHNLISVYKHNSALLKDKGEQVKTGEAVAIIGDTGLHSDGPHVHFELWYNGEAIDPEAYIVLTRE